MIIKDLLSSQTLSFDADGYVSERSYLVDVPGGTPESKLYDALVTDGIPKYNDPHPVLPDVVVTKLSVRPEKGPNQIRVTASYSIPAKEDTAPVDEDEVTPSTLSISSNLSSEETWFDINGNFLIVEYRGGSFVKAYNSANVQRPQVTVSMKRTESELPKPAIANFLGRVNATPWSGFPAKTWLCTGVNVGENKGQFEVDYTFAYKADDWRLEIVQNLTQAQIDAVPPDVDSANGYAVYDVYPVADFNQLGLNF